MSPAFRLVEKNLQPSCHEIQVVGEADLAVADQLRAALERAAAEHNQILIALQRCEFIDSTVIAVILQAQSQMGTRGQRIAVYGASGQVHRVLSITGLTQNGLVFETADEALMASE
jgi:anti-anti-sigma factor